MSKLIKAVQDKYEAEVDKFCNNDTCEIDLEAIKETQEV